MKKVKKTGRGPIMSKSKMKIKKKWKGGGAKLCRKHLLWETMIWEKMKYMWADNSSMGCSSAEELAVKQVKKISIYCYISKSTQGYRSIWIVHFLRPILLTCGDMWLFTTIKKYSRKGKGFNFHFQGRIFVINFEFPFERSGK